jgi:hypothetical protein
MTDANTIKFAANLPNGADVFVIQVGSAVTLNAPANNTVGTDQLQNLAVATGKIADNAVTLDKQAHGTQGGVLYYGASGVPSELAAGTNGYYLKTQGGSANPVWAAVSQYSTPLTTQGDVLYRDGSGDARLAAGTAGQVLTTGGAGANVSWADAASTTLDGCAYENDQTIAAGTYSIAAGKGAHSVGPITNNGTVTVNGTWVIS